MEKQCQHNILSYGETMYITQNMIQDYLLKKIYIYIYSSTY